MMKTIEGRRNTHGHDELDANNTHPDVPMKVIHFNEFLEISNIDILSKQ